MKRSEAINTFDLGLLMDLNPIVTPNNVVTNCLNGTLITYNGNENVLLNDMGNGRVETAYLPEGYVPLGTAELGGIIYIVSYNPLIKKCQIGSFPSPLRNVSTDRFGLKNKILDCTNFYEQNSTDNVIVNSLKLELVDDVLHSGDKFCITSPDLHDSKEILSAYGSKDYDINDLPLWLKLHVVSIQDDGKIIYLDDSLTWYDIDLNPYYINNVAFSTESEKSPTEYRNLVNSNYSVFNSKVAGKLAILAELEAINTFSIIAIIDTRNDSSTISPKKYAKISFALNWTYENKNFESRKKINPIGVGYTVNWPTSNQERRDINIPEELTLNRKNDGTDDEVIIECDEYEYDSNSQPLSFLLTPKMEYGYLKYLSTTIDIDLNKIGSGITDLTEYRYFVEDLLMTLSYGFDSYPQEGKLVNSAKFEFYKFSLDIYDNIKNNPKIDSNYIIKRNSGELTWDDGSVIDSLVETNDTKVPFEIVNTSSSILGHFSERIFFDENELFGLKQDNCYLTKITIDYNGEEERIYYRLLYTSTIFNTAYYAENDFKNLRLEEYLKSKPIQSNVKIFNTEEAKRIILNNNKQIPNIPSISLDGIKTERYDIIDSFTNRAEFDLGIESEYSPDLFKIDIESINKIKDISPSFEDDSKLKYITVGDETLKIIPSVDTDSPKYSIENGSLKYSLAIKSQVITPVFVNYSKNDIIKVEHLFKQLDGDIYYLGGNGRDKGMEIGLALTRINPEDSIASCKTGDDVNKTWYNFNSMGLIGLKVGEVLETKDWIAVCCHVWRMIKDGACRLGSLVSTNGAKNEWGNRGKYDEGSVKACLVFFALKTETGIDAIARPAKYYGQLFRLDVILNAGNNALYFSTIDEGSFTDDIKSEFSNYYKLSKYSGEGKVAYSYDNIIYWENFNLQINITGKIDYTNKLKIKDIEIESNSPINNLKYTNSVNNLLFLFAVTNRIILDSIISNLLSGSMQKTFVYDPISLNFLQFDLTPNKRALYIYNLLNKTFDEVESIDSMGKLKFRFDGDSLILSNNLDKNERKVSVYWHFENQSLKILNISLWTP